MASRPEVGHAKKSVNFQGLITCARVFEPIYNSSKTTFKRSQIRVLGSSLRNSLSDFATEKKLFHNVLHARITEFKGQIGLSTSPQIAIQSTDA